MDPLLKISIQTKAIKAEVMRYLIEQEEMIKGMVENQLKPEIIALAVKNAIDSELERNIRYAIGQIANDQVKKSVALQNKIKKIISQSIKKAK